MFSKKQNLKDLYRKPKRFKDFHNERQSKTELVKRIFDGATNLLNATSVVSVHRYNGDAAHVKERCILFLQLKLARFYKDQGESFTLIQGCVGTKNKAFNFKKVRGIKSVYRQISSFFTVKKQHKPGKAHQHRYSSSSTVDIHSTAGSHERAWTSELITIPIWGSNIDHVYMLCGGMSSRYSGLCVPKFLDALVDASVELLKFNVVSTASMYCDYLSPPTFLKLDIEINCGSKIDIELLKSIDFLEIVATIKDFNMKLTGIELSKEELFWMKEIYEFFKYNYRGKMLQPMDRKVSHYYTIDSFDSDYSIETLDSRFQLSQTGFYNSKLYFNPEDYPKYPLNDLFELLRSFLLILNTHHRNLVVFVIEYVSELSDILCGKSSLWNMPFEKAKVIEGLGQYFGESLFKTKDPFFDKAMAEELFTIMICFKEQVMFFDQSLFEKTI